MNITDKNFFKTSDGAHIFFNDMGEGIPIIMIPGFLCTTKFFEKNAEVLSLKHRVILMDPRGQGNSSKTLAGNTLKRHAQDVKELIEHLQLDRVILAGWSLSASTVVLYADLYREAHLAGIALIDGTLYPFSDYSWNRHRGKGYNIDKWMENYMLLYYDQKAFFDRFLSRISGQCAMDSETRAWIKEECMKTMPWNAMELHYDFCHTDNYSCLKNLSVPIALFGGDSEAYGLDMLDAYAKEIQGYCEIHKFYKSGHLMFLYEAEKFNDCFMNFAEKVVKI